MVHYNAFSRSVILNIDSITYYVIRYYYKIFSCVRWKIN